jgi:hypothetical protein
MFFGGGVLISRAEPAIPRERSNMRTNAPKQITWLVAVVFGVVGIVSYFVTIPGLSANAFWVVSVAFVLLALATFMKGL